MTPTLLAFILFAVTTALGLYLSFLVFRDKPPSGKIITLHGCCTIVGFILLADHSPTYVFIILLFALATSFGLVLLYQELASIKFTKWLCVAHGVLTLSGLFFLSDVVFRTF